MRKCVLFLGFIFLSAIYVFASLPPKRVVNDSIEENIKGIREIINSKEWVVVDSQIFFRIVELIDFINSEPIDSVIENLRTEIDSSDIFITRNISKIRSVDGINGFVTQREKNLKLKEIEEDIREKFPYSSIVVPEDQFAGSYSKVLMGDRGRDSLLFFSDSVTFLDNNRLIKSYRDSLSDDYRQKYLKNKIDLAQKNYLESVNRKNYEQLTLFNDSAIIKTNNIVKDKIASLIDYIERMPQNVTIYNLFKEPVIFPLQNSEGSYKWIWLKNSSNDSIGIRIENIDRKSVRMLVDETVSLSRLTVKEGLEIEKISPMEQVKINLHKVVAKIPKYSPWTLQGKAYAGFSQTYINDFWSQGGKSSASALTTFFYEAKYSKDKFKWESFVDSKVGLIWYLLDEGEETLRNWHKNTDSFELNSRFGYSAFKKWYYSAEANFKTQFFLGYKNLKEINPSSAFFSPAYLTFSAGLDYKPGKSFSAFLSPLSLKTTYVNNELVDETVFGIKEGETRHSRIGISGKFDFSKSIFQNVSLKSKNSIFLNYGFNDSNEWQFVKLPDFDSETSIDFKVNQYITTQVNFHLVYDKDVESKWIASNGTETKGTRLQVKEFFTLGISYKL